MPDASATDLTEAADNNPVFVAGYPRSGTTLVYRILARSPQFAAVRDLHDASHETAISVYMNPLSDLDSIYRQAWPNWRAVIGDEHQFGQFAAAIAAATPLRRLVERSLTRLVFRDRRYLDSPLDVDSLCVRGWFEPSTNLFIRKAAMALSIRRTVLRKFINLYAEQAGAPRLLEKYPFNYYRFIELSAALPAARFVFVVRDPRDVFASLVHRARVELAGRIPIGRISWMLLAADTFAADWLTSIRAYQAFHRNAPASVFLLRYEDLTEQPAAVINRLATFCGVQPAELNLQPGDATSDASRRFPISATYPVVNSGRFIAELHDADVATIRSKCGAVMAELGYGRAP